jgi:copper chaperone CopZ
VETVSFKISGICSCEGSIVEKRLKKLKGVDTFTLSMVTNRLSVIYDPTLVSPEGIEKEVGKAGAKTARV